MEEIKASIPQGNVLGPVIHLLFTGDISQQQFVKICNLNNWLK